MDGRKFCFLGSPLPTPLKIWTTSPWGSGRTYETLGSTTTPRSSGSLVLLCAHGTSTYPIYLSIYLSIYLHPPPPPPNPTHLPEAVPGSHVVGRPAVQCREQLPTINRYDDQSALGCNGGTSGMDLMTIQRYMASRTQPALMPIMAPFYPRRFCVIRTKSFQHASSRDPVTYRRGIERGNSDVSRGLPERIPLGRRPRTQQKGLSHMSVNRDVSIRLIGQGQEVNRCHPSVATADSRQPLSSPIMNVHKAAGTKRGSLTLTLSSACATSASAPAAFPGALTAGGGASTACDPPPRAVRPRRAAAPAGFAPRPRQALALSAEEASPGYVRPN
jgi:hypothetical protein